MGSKEGRVPGKDVPEMQKPLLDEGEEGEEGRGEGMKTNENKKKWYANVEIGEFRWNALHAHSKKYCGGASITSLIRVCIDKYLEEGKLVKK